LEASSALLEKKSSRRFCLYINGSPRRCAPRNDVAVIVIARPERSDAAVIVIARLERSEGRGNL